MIMLWAMFLFVGLQTSAGPAGPIAKNIVVRDTIKQQDLNQQALPGNALYTITRSGRYQLGSDLTAAPSYNNCSVIRIAASNVILDCCALPITQDPSSGQTIIAIEIASQAANIQIHNAMITDIKGTGITINPAAANICIKESTVDKCTHTGIVINQANTVSIERARITRCDGSHENAINGAIGIDIICSTNIKLDDVACIANNNTAGDSTGIRISTSTSCLITDSTASNNTGANAYGFSLTTSCVSCQIVNCMAVNNTSTNGDAIGFRTHSCEDIKIVACQAESNNSLGGRAIGFIFENSGGSLINSSDAQSNKSSGNHAYGYLISQSDGITIASSKAVRNCALNNYHTYGFYLTECTYSKIADCLAQSNYAGGSGDTHGYYTIGGRGNVFERNSAMGNRGGTTVTATGSGFTFGNGERQSTIVECESKNNHGGNGTGYGIKFGAPGETIINCTVKNNSLTNNAGTFMYGFKDFSAMSTIFFANNFAYGQGRSMVGTALSDTGSNNFWFALGGDGNATKIITEVGITDFTNLTGSAAHNVSLYQQEIHVNNKFYMLIPLLLVSFWTCAFRFNPLHLMLPETPACVLELEKKFDNPSSIIKRDGNSLFPPPPVFGRSYIRTLISKGDIKHSVASGQAMYTISSPGYYILADNILAAPTSTNTSCIRIDANDVILDLSAHSISQLSTTTGKTITGIEVTSGKNQFAIINGGVSHINGIGIKINPTSSNFLVSTLLINDCTIAGCAIDTVTNIAIENMVITNCNGNNGGAVLGACGLQIINSSEIRISDSFFNTNQAFNPTKNSTGVYLANVKSTRLMNCAASGQRGANAFGFRLTSSASSCILRDCGALNNISTTGNSYGLSLETASEITIRDFYAGSLSATGGECCGIAITNSSGIDFVNCLVKGTKAINGSSAMGFKCMRMANSRFVNCHALANVATSSSVYGFYLYGCAGNAFSNCESRANSASTSPYDAYGFYTARGGGNAFSECRAINNTGGNTTTSIAAGFALRNGEAYSGVTESIASGSTTAGQAYGIMIGHSSDSAVSSFSTIHKNYLVYNLGSKSYGYRDFAPYTTTILTSNIAYGQGAINPSSSEQLTLKNAMNFMFTHTGGRYPTGTVAEASIGNLNTVSTSAPLMNLSLII